MKNKILWVVLVLVILGGGAYWYWMQSSIQPVTSAIDVSDIQQNTPAAQPQDTNTAKTPPAGMQTYTSTVYGFSIQYPSSAQVSWADPAGKNLGKGPQIFTATLKGPSDAAGSIIGEFDISTAYNSDTLGCLSSGPTSDAKVSAAQNVTLNGAQFYAYKVDDSFAGGSSTGYHYKAVSGIYCFDVYYYAQYSGGAAGSTLDIPGAEAKLNAQLQAMVQTLKFASTQSTTVGVHILGNNSNAGLGSIQIITGGKETAALGFTPVQTVDITGWSLWDQNKSKSLTIGTIGGNDIVLSSSSPTAYIQAVGSPAKNAVAVIDKTQEGPTPASYSIYLGATANPWAVGDVIQLVDSKGQVVDIYDWSK